MAAAAADLPQAWQWNAHFMVAGRTVAAVVGARIAPGEPGELTTTTRLPVPNGPDIVSPCRAKLTDIQRAETVRNGNLSAVKITLKANRTAECSATGNAQDVTLPADDAALAARVASAINTVCCAAGTSMAPRLTKPGIVESTDGQSGVVRIRVLIAPDGSVQTASVLSSTNPQVNDTATYLAVSSTYAPALSNGKPVAASYVGTFMVR